MKLVRLNNLATFANEVKARYATISALEALSTKVDGLITAGGEPNVLEGVKVNGTALAIADKMVDILIATGATNGTISVNNAEVAVAGLQALAFKAQISEADLDSALAAVIASKAAQSDVTALQTAVNTLNGSGDGSVTKTVNDAIDAFAAKVSDDGIVNTLKELVDWVAEHGPEAGEMAAGIQDNAEAIAALAALVGTLPEGATSTTVVGYIAEAIAAIGIGDYAKTTEVTAAINTALAGYYTKGEVDGFVNGLDGRLQTVEGKAHEHANADVINGITAEKVAAWDAAEQNAKDHATTLNNAMDTRMQTVEGKAHEHANKAELDLIAAGDKAKWDAVAADYVKASEIEVISDAEITALFA